LDAIFTLIDENKKIAELNLEQLINRYEMIHSDSSAWFIALYYCYIKDIENTYIWLQKSYERHEVEISWLCEGPLLIPLRNDERNMNLYQKVEFSKIE